MGNLREKSRKRYEAVYRTFMDWCTLRKFETFSEDLLLAYFEEMSETYSASSLWSSYSMLRNQLAVNHYVDIEPYIELREFIKAKSRGHKAKQPKLFTREQLDNFISTAPDYVYLAGKVVLL